MKEHLLRHPFIRILAALITGILLFQHLSHGAVYILIGFILLGCLGVFSFSKKAVWKRFAHGILILGILMLFGFLMQMTNEHFKLQKQFVPAPGYYLGQIIEIPIQKKKSWNCVIQLFPPDSIGNSRARKVQAYLPLDSLQSAPMLYDYYLLKLSPDSIRNDNNPDAFDYRSIMARRGVYFSARINTDDYQLVEDLDYREDFSLINSAKSIREKLLIKLRTGSLDPDAAALSSALVLGFKHDLDENLKKTFSEAGVVHVLAVSGLHVGIIYLILEKIFWFIPLTPWGRIIRYFLIIGSLWFYVLLAGFSASVFRAALMFSLFQTAKLLRRDASIYNVIAASASIILINNPSTLFELGFLFSYLAVAGIVLLHSFIYRKLFFKWKILDYAWSALLVSFSAQLFVTPLSLYYFHQFPVYFLIANLLLVPLVILYIYPAILHVLFGSFSLITQSLEFVLESIFSLIELLSEFMVSLPSSLIRGLYLDSIEVLLLYGVLAFILHYFLKKFKRSFLFALVFLLLFASYRNYQHLQCASTKEMVIFNSPGSWFISIAEGRNLYLLFVNGDKDQLRKKITNFLKKRRIKNEVWINLDQDSIPENLSIYYESDYLLAQDQIFYFARAFADNTILWEETRFVLSQFPLNSDTALGRENIFQRSGSKFPMNMLYNSHHQLALSGARIID